MLGSSNAIQNIKISIIVQFIQFYFKSHKNYIKQERTVSITKSTNFDNFKKRDAKVEHGDLGVGDLIIKPRGDNRSEIAKPRVSGCSRPICRAVRGGLGTGSKQ